MNAGRTSAGDAAPDLSGLESVLGYSFKNPNLLRQALIHSSALGKHGATQTSNERLEFLGDRVLGLIIADRLLSMFPEEAEGEVAPRLAELVSSTTLAAVAAECGLASYLQVAAGQHADDADTAILADACEAVMAALYLDGGLEVARGFVLSHWEGRMEANVSPPKDSKTALQEWAQARGLALPSYRLVSSEGPPHAPIFVMAVSVAKGDEAIGTGRTKRQATAVAAAALLERVAAEAPNEDSGRVS